MTASRRDAVPAGWIFTRIELTARYPVMVPPALSYCGCRLTSVVLMSLRSTPALASASMTACWRLLVWSIAPVTSRAVNSMPTSAVSVSGTPCTWPEPTTVTWRGLSPTHSGLWSQADAAAARPNASTRRIGALARWLMGMLGTLVADDGYRVGVAVEGAVPAAPHQVITQRHRQPSAERDPGVPMQAEQDVGAGRDRQDRSHRVTGHFESARQIRLLNPQDDHSRRHPD